MDISIVQIYIPNGRTRNVTLYQGMIVSELKALLQSCFHGHEVIGLQDSDGSILPLSLILLNQKNYENKKYEAVIKYQYPQIEDSKDVSNLLIGSEFLNGKGKSTYDNESLVKLSNNDYPNEYSTDYEYSTSTNTNSDPASNSTATYYSKDSTIKKEIIVYDGEPLTIAEAKVLLGLAQYSSEFIIDFFIQQIEKDNVNLDDDDSWLINQVQYQNAISMLLHSQYQGFTVKQRSISNYIVRNIFILFEESNSGYCDLRKLGCGLMLFSGGELSDRAHMAYKLVAESERGDENIGCDGNVYATRDEGVNNRMMTIAIASILNVVAILNSSYLNSCNPYVTAEEITKRAFIRSKSLLSNGLSIGQEDFEYWFSVVLTIYNEVEEEDENEEETNKEELEQQEREDEERSRLKKKAYNTASGLCIDTETGKNML